MHAQTAEAAQWWARPRGETNASWVTNYQNSLKVRHRDAIVEALRGIAGATSVLEVGSHCGPNLVRLAQDIPELEQLSGVDVNQDAIAFGQQWVQRLGLSDRIELVTGRIPEATDRLADQCVDVVLSCYALAYIAPPDLDTVLYEMGRLAKRAVILAEPMTDGQTVDGHRALSGYAEWAHNYKAASRWIGTWRECDLTVTRIEPPVDRLNAILVAKRREG